MPATIARSKRNTRLSLRTTQAKKRLLETAAARQDVTVSDFVLESACEKAEDILAEEKHFSLSPEKWKSFTAALDRPTQPKPRLKKLLADRSVLER